MDNTNDGGAAYPTIHNWDVSAGVQVEPGMTLRDYFAAAALQGLLAYSYDEGQATAHMQATAENAYDYADAMLEVRNRVQPVPSPNEATNG